MSKLLEISNEELELVIDSTSDRLNMAKAIIEKDLWVCMILNYLFSEFKYKDSIVFKGGTSLSKVYKLIERFSEDIDLALDWKVLGYGAQEPYEDRSNTKQIKFNEALNNDTKMFLKDELLPILQKDFNKILKDKSWHFYIDEVDGQTICFDYPKSYTDSSILQVIRLEIGCLAEPIPVNNRTITTYIEDVHPDVFNEHIEVIAVDSLRTFFEKLTILHREANRINGNYPTRYSRHFYDVYKMLLTDIKEKSFENIQLLKAVIEFKKKFYTSKWAKYDEILEGKLKLIPAEDGLTIFSEDYDSMKKMLFGEKIPFDRIIKTLQEYEYDLNEVIKNK